VDQRFSAAIFDFDETLVDLEVHHRAATACLCRDLGADYTLLPESFRNQSGLSLRDEIVTCRRFFAWQEEPEELLARRAGLLALEIHAAGVALMPGARRVLESLHDHGLALAVASSGVHSYVNAILADHGLADLFAAIITGEQVVEPKPAPEPYLLAARMLRRQPAQCLAFEDSGLGVQSAKAAGMFCVAIRNATALQYQDLSAADLVLSSLDDFSLDDVAPPPLLG
jgi:HAD superfamily hydrolase (TIGR01509 family)